MRKTLLLSAALLAVLAGPALAQRDDHGRGGDDHNNRPAPAAAAPQQAAPQQAVPSNRGEAARQSQARQQTQRTQAEAARAPRIAQGNNRPDNNNRPDANRGGNDNSRPDFNRGGNGQRDNNSRPDANRGNNNGRADFSRNDNRNGSRTNWSQYHHAFNASRQFHYRGPSYVRPQGWYSRRWSYGEFLPSLFWSSNYWINDFGYYDLPPPPVGAVWVRDGSDALLIDRYSGEIIEVEYGIFY
jgi:Ni/Co efflux regulator RcnB